MTEIEAYLFLKSYLMLNINILKSSQSFQPH